MNVRRNLRLMALMAGAHTVGFYLTLVALMFLPIPDQNRELVSMMIGHLSGFVAGIVTYHFGSSSESADKNATIGTLAETAKLAGESLAPTHVAPDVTIPAGQTATVKAGEGDVQHP